MSRDTRRVSSTRVPTPPAGEAVLAVSLHWGDRLVAYEHLEPGARGQAAVRWRGASAEVPVAGGPPLTAAPGELVTAALPSGLTLTARLRRREGALPAVEPSPSHLFFLRVLAFAALGLLAVIAMMVVTPVVEDEGPSFFRGDEPGPTAHFVVPVPTVARVFDAARAPVDPGRQGKARPRPASTPSTGHAARPDVRATARALLDEMMGGASSQVLAPGLAGELDEALKRLSAPATSTASAEGLVGLGARGSGRGASTSGLGIGGVGTVGGTLGAGQLGLVAGHRDAVSICNLTTSAVSDGLSRDDVARVVKRHESEVRFCYESGLTRRPGISGKLTVQWAIAESGDVASADVDESSLGAEDVEDCVLSRVRRWRFLPHHGGVVVVNFSWVFSVAGGDTGGEDVAAVP